MPELPEVEVVRRGLKRFLLGRKLTGLRIFAPQSVIIGKKRAQAREEAEEAFEVFIGATVREVFRVGKLLIISFGEKKLAIHLRMTGQIILYKTEEEKIEKYTRAILEFDGLSMSFNDKRKFGYIELLTHEGSFRSKIDSFGIDALSPKLNEEYLEKLILKRKTSVKKLLLNQKVIAGIGNAYSDEILFLSRISPLRPVDRLTKDELKNIVEATKAVLEKSIRKGGLTFRDFLNVTGKAGNFRNYLRVYKRSGEPCLRCGKIIVKEKISGRSSYFCPHCQK